MRRRAHQGTGVFFQARQTDLERAARHRGRLQMAAILDPSRHAAADPARRRDRTAGRENILTSHHLVGWTETPDGVRADFIDKATGKPAGSYDGAVLIAADGIHSAIREKLYPQEGPPIWNGRILWRGITASDAFLSGRTMIMAGHEILKFVCYPISQAAGCRRQALRSTGSPSGTCRRPTNGGARITTAPPSSTSSCPGSRTGNSTGSTCPA